MQLNSIFTRRLHSIIKHSYSAFKRNPYDVLGIRKTASKGEIKKAFIELTKKYHPDRNPDTKDKYAEINNAYQILSNDIKRKDLDKRPEEYEEDEVEEPYDFHNRNEFTGFHYDNYGGDWEFEEGENHFESVFRDYDDFFKFPESTYKQAKAVKGTNILIEIEISFPEAINGCRREILFWKRDVCTICEGSKSKPGTTPIKCKACDCTGSKSVRDGNTIIKTECRKCVGKGYIIKEKCESCKGEGVEFVQKKEMIIIPRGVRNGHEIKLFGKGNKGDHGGQRGDICIVLQLVKDDYYRIDGYDLHIEKEITLSRSILGGEEIVETLEGDKVVNVPRHFGNNSYVVLQGKGLKGLHDEDLRGDLYVWFRVKLPETISDDQKEVLDKIKKLELNLKSS
jgi:molecular chaperone DnaJ